VFQARASPDGRWLAVQTRPQEGVGRDVLYLLSLLDLRFHPVIQNSWITSLAWAPSGDALAFSQWTDGPVQIMLYDLIRQQTSLLVEERDSGPWSVEGWVGKQKLVLSRLRGGGLMIDQIALLDLQTRRLEILYTDPTAHTTMASVSPDGRTILIGQAESLPALSIQVLHLDLADRHLTPLIKREDPEAMMLTVPVWSPSGTRVAFVAAAGYAPGSSEKGGGKEVPQAQRVVILDVQNGHTSRVVEVPSPNPSIQVLAWLSEEVLLITTLEEQLNDLVLYSIRTDGTGKQRILDLGGGRFLTTLPHYLPRDDFNRPNGPLGPH
jgi:Tol biopolymer transport system component